jgi:hypothetical protein
LLTGIDRDGGFAAAPRQHEESHWLLLNSVNFDVLPEKIILAGEKVCHHYKEDRSCTISPDFSPAEVAVYSRREARCFLG